jgi:dihydrofolate reductase
VLVLSRSAAAGAADSADTKNADAAARHSRAESPRFFPGLGAALEYARPRYRRICIAGGESVDREALPLAAALLITRVNAAPEGDRFFPLDLDNAPGWTLFREEARAGFSFTVWKRVHAPESDQE